MTYSTTAEAIDAARQHQLQASTMEQTLQDPDRASRDQIELMRQWAPAAPVADSLCALGWHPQPVDVLSLAATGKPLTSVEQILAHWRVRPADGVAIPAGVQPSGSTLVALKGSPAALRQWLADAGTQVLVSDEGDGYPIQSRSYRECPPYVEIRWAPPARAPITSSAFFGRDEGHEIADRVMKPREEPTGAPAFLVWQSGLVWQAGPPAAQRLTFKSTRIAPGVQVVCDGPIPFHVVRGDGWQLTATRTPVEVDLPGWLVSALGGALVAVKT